MLLQVKALYDFEADPGSGELNLITGDIISLTHICQGVSEGWLEGTNAKGESGLFPEAYVKEYEEDVEGPPSVKAPPPKAPPPPLPTDAGGNNQPPNTAATTANTDDAWGNTGLRLPGGNTEANH